MPFTICLNTSTIKPQPLMEKIRLTAEAGFRGVEIWINDVYKHISRGGEVSDIEKAVADYGLIVPCTIALRQWGEAAGLEYNLALDEARRRMELAARLGSPWIVATPPREPCDLNQIADRYGKLLELGREAGVKPTFEYISFFKSASRLDQAWQVVQQVQDDDATLILDAFHSWNSGSTLDDLRAVPAGRISHYHIDDAPAHKPAGQQTDPDRVMPGDGVINLAAEIAILQEKGYNGTVSLELFNQELWSQNPAGVLKTGYERVRQLVE